MPVQVINKNIRDVGLVTINKLDTDCDGNIESLYYEPMDTTPISKVSGILYCGYETTFDYIGG